MGELRVWIAIKRAVPIPRQIDWFYQRKIINFCLKKSEIERRKIYKWMYNRLHNSIIVLFKNIYSKKYSDPKGIFRKVEKLVKRKSETSIK